MKRLLQLATAVLLLAGFVAPIIEFFDYWDEEGLADDTEFGVFALVFALCLVLWVSELISTTMLQFSFTVCGALERVRRAEHTAAAHRFIFLIPPLHSLPLRI